jgi:hypothetical protein
MVVPPGRQIQSAQFNLEEKNVSRRRNLPAWMQEIASAIRWTIWTTAEVRAEIRANYLRKCAQRCERKFLGIQRAPEMRYWLS